MPVEPLAIQHHTLESYFFEEIEGVQERTGWGLPTDVEAYVVSLLARYAQRTQAAGRRSRALALEYMRAKSESGAAKTAALRGVGDRALYISGVVPRSLSRSPVNVRYVRGIGIAAYREVASSGPLRVLGLLAEMFEHVANVIGETISVGREKLDGDDVENLLAIFERWRRDQDPRDAKRLLAAGVMLHADGSDLIQ